MNAPRLVEVAMTAESAHADPAQVRGRRPVRHKSPVTEPGPGSFPARRWLALAIMLAAGFMDLVDTTIVNVAVPSIIDDLAASYADVQWIIAGYLLAVAVGLITFGRLGDIVGRKRVFLLGVVGFGITSLCCALAPTPEVLVGSRVLQGLSAAAMIPQILSTIQVSFPREEQPKALSLYSSMAGVALLSGPLLAGVLLSVLDLSWRSIFIINVPIAAIVVMVTIPIVPESRSAHARRLDLPGVAIISAALFALVFGLVQGRELGWPIWVLGLLISSVPLFAVFIGYERRRERRGGSPLIPPSMFRQRSFSAGLVIVLVFFSGVVGFFLAFSIFLQFGLGFSPLESALTTFPSSLGLIVSSLLSTKLAPRMGRRILAVGALVMTGAIAGLAVTVSYHESGLTAWDVRPVIFMFGLGMGIILPPLADVIVAGVHQRDVGAASGLISTGMQVGNAIGVAAIGVILFGGIGSHAADRAQAVAPALAAQLTDIGVTGSAQEEVISQFQTCFVDTANQSDPTGRPASCESASSGHAEPVADRVAELISASATQAREDTFVAAIHDALLYEMAVFLATFLLLFLLPPPHRGRHRAPPGHRRHSRIA